MKIRSPIPSFLAIIFSLAVTCAQAQDASPDKTSRPRTVGSLVQTSQTSREPQPGQQQPVQQLPGQQQQPQPRTSPQPVGEDLSKPAPAPPQTETSAVQTLTQLSPPWVQARKAEAQRLLKSRPLATAMTSPSIEFVTLAALDRATSRTHLITLSKQTFLTKGAEITTTSSLGTLLQIRVLRANGVNTAVSIVDPEGQSLLPLLVEFPIEKGGLFREMAYYTSAHPALLSSDLERSGQSYVRNMLDLANKRLKDKGVFISPDIVNVAERLCIVEHIDHDRFRLENRLALFSEIYSLYALNELDTYRYSVSVAGAGGMVQMIPWAYNLERQRHPGVGLIPDFVTGMRNHGNALQAMLLYMQDTWNELAANEDVKDALNSKLATTSELLAAGYNSNAARLPLYLRRGGDEWKMLIPRETQTYLQIYRTFEGLVPLKSRTNVGAQSGN
jgi:hypothetical protein